MNGPEYNRCNDGGIFSNFWTTSFTSLTVDHVLTVIGLFFECESDTSLTKTLRSGPEYKDESGCRMFFSNFAECEDDLIVVDAMFLLLIKADDADVDGMEDDVMAVGSPVGDVIIWLLIKLDMFVMVIFWKKRMWDVGCGI